MDVQSIRDTSEPHPGQKKRRPESRKHTKDLRSLWIRFGYLSVFHSDLFRHNATFFRKLSVCTKGSPLHFCNRMMFKKFKRSAPFTFFGTVTLFKKSHFFVFFSKTFKCLQCSKGSPLNFFSYFATNWSFKKHGGSPFYNFTNVALFEL